MAYVRPHRHYQHAPIKEALIDIQVQPAISLAVLGAMPAEPNYSRQALYQGSFTGQMQGPKITASTASNQIGYQYRSESEKHVAQMKVDGFTFSRLEPYENWDGLCAEARRVWKKYRTVAPTQRIRRVALRYINQIDIPAATAEIRDYFRCYPEISPDIPQALTSFFSQLQLPIKNHNAMLILTQAMVPPPAEGFASIMLDIDVFRDNAEFVSDDDAWLFLETLRDQKNMVFEGSITDRVRELIS